MEHTSFWLDHNGWWKQFAATVVSGKAAERDWAEARERLVTLSCQVPAAEGISSHDRQDLVQVVLLKLLDETTISRLAEVEAPAHYLARVMGNFLLDELDRHRVKRRLVQRYALLGQTPLEEDRPEAQAASNELQALARYLVNHVVSRRDRVALWGWARGDSVPKIAARLQCTAGHAAVILLRAKKKLRDLFQSKYGG